MKCPSCRFEQPDAHTSCECCGLIFAKYNPQTLSPSQRRLKEREERQALQTPENGWTVHQWGKYRWASQSWTLVGQNGIERIRSRSSIFLTLLALHMLLGFFIAIFWAREAMPAYFIGIPFWLGLFLFFHSFSKLRQKRSLEDMPLSTLRAMAPGQVEVQGLAGAEAPLVAPFTQTPCAYYEYDVARYESGKEKNWVTLKSGDSRQTPFTLDDGTGRTILWPQGADIFFKESFTVESIGGEGLLEPVLSFLKTKGLEGRLKGRLRLTERVFQIGQRVYVMGVCRMREDGSGLLFIGGGKRPEDHFLISDKSEEDLRRQFSGIALGQLFAGLVLVTASVYFLVRMVLK